MDIMSGSFVEWHDEDFKPHRRYLIDKLFVGRVCRGVDAERCVRVSQPPVSRDHAVIQLTRSGVKITDLSINGTWVNGVRMAAGASMGLADGDTIQVGEAILRLFCRDQEAERPQEGWGAQTAISPSIIWITSLVADVRGFSAMCQAMDSDLTYSLMNEVFSRFSAVVTAFKGTVKDYAGDAVFAFWEHPDGQSADPAILACRAAMEQHRRVPEIQTVWGHTGEAVGQLRLGWGITTGPVTLSHYAARPTDLALVGDSINLAFRLSSMANKEVDAGILLSRHTAELVQSELDLLDLGRISTKGREGLEQIYGIKF